MILIQSRRQEFCFQFDSQNFDFDSVDFDFDSIDFDSDSDDSDSGPPPGILLSV